MKLRSLNYNHLMLGYDIELFIGDIDICEAQKEAEMNYYGLSKDEQWMGSDSPYDIGGRDTDVSQIAYSLEHRVRELYPINQVPKELEERLNNLKEVCVACESEINKIIELISDYEHRRTILHQG